MPKLYGFSSLNSHFSSKRKEVISKLNKIAKEDKNGSIQSIMARFEILAENLNLPSIIESKYITYRIDDFVENLSKNDDYELVIKSIKEFSQKMKLSLNKNLYNYMRVFINEALCCLKVVEMVDVGMSQLDKKK